MIFGATHDNHDDVDKTPPNQSTAAQPKGSGATIGTIGPASITTFEARPALRREWLEADGLGGFASGTVDGIRTRRYHALLLCASRPPSGRLVLVNGVEAWLEGPDGPIALSTQHYAPDIVHPDGWRRTREFTPLPWPRWRFDAAGTQLSYEIFASGDGGDIVLRWRLLQPAGANPLITRLWVRPLLSVRDYHSVQHENAGFDFTPQGQDGRISWRPYADRPAVSALSNGEYKHDPAWFRQFLYIDEEERGLESQEDLASPGMFGFDLAKQEAVMILRAGDSRDVQVLARATQAAALRQQRWDDEQNKIPNQAQTEVHPEAHINTLAVLRHAASSYFVERGQGSTIVAGYPWFTDWGRDTFISLRGLTLCTGRSHVAAAILSEWAKTVSEGMLPNRFPDSGDVPEYNAVDASLWYIVALHAYLQVQPDTPALQHTLQAAAEKILEGYAAGTRYAIHACPDGLLHAGENGSQLTWMDARFDNRAVTPRIGKPVEVQALWINALRIGASWNPRWGELAAQASASFHQRFINPETGALYDVVDVDGELGKVDASIRPNQIFAVGGLPFGVVELDTARAIVAEVERTLLTPLGLRTLAQSDPRYIGLYQGGPAHRDTAYHQGTAWPWLTGAFVEAWLRVHTHGLGIGKVETADAVDAIRAEARKRFVAPLDAHLWQAGVGHLSEIADGDWPHVPRGAPFQAWSLAERLRMEQML